VGGHLEGTEGERGYRFIWGDLSGRRHLEDLGIDVIKLLKLNFEKQNGARKWTGLI